MDEFKAALQQGKANKGVRLKTMKAVAALGGHTLSDCPQDVPHAQQHSRHHIEYSDSRWRALEQRPEATQTMPTSQTAMQQVSSLSMEGQALPMHAAYHKWRSGLALYLG